ncbi:30S ribosome-binding factor RbfA [Alkaliphilus pronyensis]|uniref:Ribosome-binding factor A n=1 Tax=Alkaliphilus pronyensis TaxID=1482732 RepID=A0A6I0FCJ4_9FIRM|nr:30S ribosome-binding factor RbfA [Alkaliphilus pronyensis]KAB3536946.1 30S ribosome-binding factor RbfA [Alkaliphilus pronyensis]
MRVLANPRVNRLAEEIKKHISYMIRNELRDPRIAPMTSITEVEVTRDLRYASVYVSIFGNKEEQSNTIEALKKSSGFIRREIGHKIKSRYTPEILFKLDKSIELGFEIQNVIARINKDDKIKEEENE